MNYHDKAFFGESQALRPIAFQPHLPFTWRSYQAFMSLYSLHDGSYSSDIRSRNDFSRQLARELVLGLFFEWPQIYRSKLPVYLLARCPICGGGVYEAIDTGSLSGVGWWDNEPRGLGWYGPRHASAGNRVREVSYTAQCSHVQAVTYGINLNGILPNDPDMGDYLMMGSEKPSLFLPLISQPDEYVVIRTLPLGRLDDEVWQPRYTAYFLSYFSASAERERLLQVLAPQDPYNVQIGKFSWPQNLESYDLQPWVERGQLQWLEPQPPHSLRRGSWAEYPYRHLMGLQGRWVIHQRKVYTSRHLATCLTTSGYCSAYQEEIEQWKAALANRPLRNIAPPLP